MDLRLRTKDNTYSKEGLGITCNLGDFFYADIATDANGSAVKDFIISIGKYDAAADIFNTFYSYVLRDQVIPDGISTTTITCQTTGVGSYDCMGGIGRYNPQAGRFILENGLMVSDALYVLGISVTNATITELPPSCTSPPGTDGEVAECGCGCPNQPDTTHKYQCINGTWVDQGYNPDCAPLSCTNPSGTEGQTDECGVGGNQPDPTHKYQCINGTWVDQGYNPDCAPPGATITMEDANIPIGGNDIAKILITNVTNLGSVDAHVLYDPNVVSIQSVGGSDFDTLIPTDNGNGDLTLMAYTMGSFNGDVTLCEITFEPAYGASINDTCPLNLSGTQLLDATPQGNYIPHAVIDGIATIIASAFKKVKKWKY